MSWHAHLQLQYTRPPDSPTVVRHQHSGPLRVFQSLYPEGPAVCHNVVIHPPGGLVQGDRLSIEVDVAPGAHGLVSTPGATRFYRSTGERAEQHVQIHVASGARFEWLPLETIAFDRCRATNRLSFTLEPDAQLLAWDPVSLGLPRSGQPFTQGHLEQCMEWPGVWRDHGHIHGDDRRLLHSPAGLAGHSTLATLVLAHGTPFTRQQRESLLEATRAVVDASPLAQHCGITCPNDHMLVARALADQVEPVMALWQALWAVLRRTAWGMADTPPRVWRL